MQQRHDVGPAVVPDGRQTPAVRLRDEFAGLAFAEHAILAAQLWRAHGVIVPDRDRVPDGSVAHCGCRRSDSQRPSCGQGPQLRASVYIIYIVAAEDVEAKL